MTALSKCRNLSLRGWLQKLDNEISLSRARARARESHSYGRRSQEGSQDHRVWSSVITECGVCEIIDDWIDTGSMHPVDGTGKIDLLGICHYTLWNNAGRFNE